MAKTETKDDNIIHKELEDLIQFYISCCHVWYKYLKHYFDRFENDKSRDEYRYVPLVFHIFYVAILNYKTLYEHIYGKWNNKKKFKDSKIKGISNNESYTKEIDNWCKKFYGDHCLIHTVRNIIAHVDLSYKEYVCTLPKCHKLYDCDINELTHIDTECYNILYKIAELLKYNDIQLQYCRELLSLDSLEWCPDVAEGLYLLCKYGGIHQIVWYESEYQEHAIKAKEHKDEYGTY
jgi:hypothetical protein